MTIKKSETYEEMSARHHAEFNELSEKICFYAFDHEQFDRGVKKLGIVDVENELHQDIGGMFCKKCDAHLIEELFNRQAEEKKELQKSDDFIRAAFKHEMGNFEYALSHDIVTVLGACGFSISDVQSDKRLVKLWNEAEDKYMEEFKELNW